MITCPNCARQFTPRRLMRTQIALYDAQVEAYQIIEPADWEFNCYNCFTKFDLREAHTKLDITDDWGTIR